MKKTAIILSCAALCLLLLFLSSFWIKDIPFIRMPPPEEAWSIGIAELALEQGKLKIGYPANIQNPVFTASQVNNVPGAIFVADPFLIRKDNTYYLFFEALSSKRGDIGVAFSSDAINWRYQGIALDEPYHLSYPHILKHNGVFYMTPESCADSSVRLYVSEEFPLKWRYLKDLVKGKPFVDPTLFYHNGKFYLFAGDTSCSNLYLYVSDAIDGEFTPHPKSPLIQNDRSRSRPAGGIIKIADTFIRPAQVDTPYYGRGVRFFKITKLTPEDYQEEEITCTPLLSASGKGWNRDGMHHISALATGGGRWLCAVDGKRHINNTIYLGRQKLPVPEWLGGFLRRGRYTAHSK